MAFRILIELIALLAALIVGLVPFMRARMMALPTWILSQLARSRRWTILQSAIFTFVICAVISSLCPSVPRVPDEFSYLLEADTFAHGRLTNPSHPLWQFFESFHVNPYPTYQSRYPPAQGLFLALGQVLTGSPIVGVWISMATAAAALCWMLLAFAPPRWALFGALLPALRFGSLPLWDQYWFAYWTTTYWGGAVAMMGGALVFGSLMRATRSARPLDGAWLGLGLIVAANSRPYEGLVLAAPVGVVLLFWAWGRWREAVQFAMAAAAVLVVGFLAMGYYNYRGTGNPLKTPYLVQMELYEVTPAFIFQKPVHKVFNHEPLRAYYDDFMMEGYREKQNGAGLSPAHSKLVLQFFLGFILYVPAVCALTRPFDRWALFAAGIILLEIMGSAISAYANVLRPHYMAPAAPMFVYLAVAGVRRLRTVRFYERRIGRPVGESIVAVSLLSMVLAVGLRVRFGPSYGDPGLVRYRPEITRKLEVSGPKDLVIVTYGPKHNPHFDWVNNAADIDGSPVIWARDMGQAKNRQLLDYFRDRKVWRVYPDEDPPRLVPYEESVKDTALSSIAH